MRHRILISEKVSPETIALLEKNDIEIKYGTGIDEKSVIEEIQDCDAVMVRVMPITKNVLEHAPNLKIIAKHGVGCDNIDLTEAYEKGIYVVYAPGSNSQSVAEHTMALMLACSRHLRETNIGYGNGDYGIKNSISFSEITGKTLSLIGFGNIARIVAKMAHFGFDMKIVAYDVKNCIDDVPEYVQICNDINKVCSMGDYISIHVPGTNENRHLFDYNLLCKMKSTAFLINTSRGMVVDSESLIKVIEEGIIAGAGLDVSDPEPAVAGSMLFTNPKILLTPHSAAASNESMIRMGRIAAQGVITFFEGKKPKYVANGVEAHN